MTPEPRYARTIADAWEGGRNHFNLIRLVAAWMVIYGHAWAITGTPGGDVFAQATGVKFAGAVAVDVFFVISGFLIAASLSRNDVRGYIASRVLRIVPALVVCVALSAFVVGPLVSTAADYWTPQTLRYFLSNATLWRAEFLLPGVFETLPNKGVNGSLWTLPIEARLYVALMAASLLGLLSARRYFLPWLCAVLAAGAFAWWRAPLPDWLANDLWCVLFFITGTALWVYRERVRLSWQVAGALFCLAVFARGTSLFAVAYFAWVAYGTLWLAFVPRGPRMTHHDVSYGLYLYGWPAAQLVQLYSPGAPMHNVLWATVFALAMAGLSWCLVERPALRLKRRFGTKTPVASPAAANAA